MCLHESCGRYDLFVHGDCREPVGICNERLDPGIADDDHDRCDDDHDRCDVDDRGDVNDNSTSDVDDRRGRADGHTDFDTRVDARRAVRHHGLAGHHVAAIGDAEHIAGCRDDVDH
jgi:hypothetical protein